MALKRGENKWGFAVDRAGGGSAKRGENHLKSADGKLTKLGHRAFVEVKKGESVIIKTPGGGGYGKAGPLKKERP